MMMYNQYSYTYITNQYNHVLTLQTLSDNVVLSFTG